MKYKMIRPINAIELLKDKPCRQFFAEYIEEFGYDDINETTFPRFIEFAKNIRDGINFLLFKNYIFELWIEKIKIEDNLKPCPFCGGEVKEHPSKICQKDYKACYHEPNCWLLNKSSQSDESSPYDFTLISITEKYKEAWNRRI